MSDPQPVAYQNLDARMQAAEGVTLEEFVEEQRTREPRPVGWGSIAKDIAVALDGVSVSGDTLRRWFGEIDAVEWQGGGGSAGTV